MCQFEIYDKNHKIYHHVYLIRHVNYLLETRKPPCLYHPPRLFDTSEQSFLKFWKDLSDLPLSRIFWKVSHLSLSSKDQKVISNLSTYLSKILTNFLLQLTFQPLFSSLMQQISSKNFEKCQHCIFIGFTQKFYSFYAF